MLTGGAIQTLLPTNGSEMLKHTYNNTDFANATMTMRYSDEETTRNRIIITCTLTFLVGVVQVIMALLGLGFLGVYFSDTFVSSYTCGSAVHVLISQLKSLLGIKLVNSFTGIGNLPKNVLAVLISLPSASWRTVLISVSCIAYLFICIHFVDPFLTRRFKFHFPKELPLV